MLIELTKYRFYGKIQHILNFKEDGFLYYFTIEEAESELYNMPNLHSHEHFELYFLIRGNKSVILKSKLFNIESSTLVVTAPYVLHKFEGGPYKRILLCISPDYVSPYQAEFLKNLAEECVLTFSDYLWNQIIKILERLMEINSSAVKHKNIQSSLLLGHLLYLISENTTEYVKPDAETQNHSVTHPITLKVIEYLQKHYTEKISLEDLCAKFYVSKTWLCKCFYNNMHCSIISYQLNLRITEAKFLLRETDKSIESIAKQLGLSSAKYFGIMFKKEVNRSPLQYRHDEVKIK